MPRAPFVAIWFVLLFGATVLPVAAGEPPWQSSSSQSDSSASSSPSSPATPPGQPTQDQAAPAQTGKKTASPAPCGKHSQNGSTEQRPCEPAPSQNKKKKTAQKSEDSAPGNAAPPKTVVRNGSTPDPNVALSASETPQQASRELQSTNQLLATTDDNLKKLSGRQLDSSQQDTVNQIKNYTQQARGALDSGDVHRAYTLALKANLLAGDLDTR